MNSTTIVGRLGRDPEYTAAKDGKSQYVKIAVAVDNEFGDLTTWFDCIAFGSTADNIDKYLKKGRQVAIKGRHEQGEPFTDKNGNNRRSWTLRIERIEFLADKSSLVERDGNAPTSVPDLPEPTDSWQQAEEDCPF